MSSGLQAQGPALLGRALAMGLFALAVAGCGGSGEASREGSAAAPPAATESEPAEPATLPPGTAEPADRDTTPMSTEEKLSAQMRPNEVRELLKRNPAVLLLDVRQPEEWVPPLGHIEGAKLIPLPELNERIGEIAEWRDRPVVAVCRSGRRSEIARKALAAAGFTNVANMSGGMLEWRRTE